MTLTTRKRHTTHNGGWLLIMAAMQSGETKVINLAGRPIRIHCALIV